MFVVDTEIRPWYWNKMILNNVPGLLISADEEYWLSTFRRPIPFLVYWLVGWDAVFYCMIIRRFTSTHFLTSLVHLYSLNRYRNCSSKITPFLDRNFFLLLRFTTYLYIFSVCEGFPACPCIPVLCQLQWPSVWRLFRKSVHKTVVVEGTPAF